MPRFLKEPCSRVKGSGVRAKWTDPKLKAAVAKVLYRDRLEPLPFESIEGVVVEQRTPIDYAAELAFIIANNKAELSNVEAAVLHCRFGMLPAGPMSLGQVGQIIGVTKERVRQVQNRAMKKIRLELEKRL